MAGAQPRSDRMVRRYKITSEVGRKAAQERIDAVQTQHNEAVRRRNPDAARIYRGLLVALRAVAVANSAVGVMHGELMEKVKQESGRVQLSPKQLDEVMHLVGRHMDAIATLEAAKPAGPTHSLARERLNQGRLK